MKKQILITGGSGLIGQELVSTLRSRYDITILTRNIDKCRNLFGSGQISYINSLDSMEDIGTFNAVINLAGEPIADKRWAEKQKKIIQASRRETTRSLVNLIKASRTPPSTFISGSAIGYYGRQPGNEMISETFHNCHHEFTHHLCKEWESIALQAEPLTRVVLLRTGVVLSRKGGFLKKMEPLFRLGIGGVAGSGQQMISWIHIRDMVRAIVFLLENESCHGPFNLTAPTPVSNRNFVQMLSRQLHRPALGNMPGFLLRILFGELSDLFLYGQNVIPEKLSHAGFSFDYPNLEASLKALYEKS